MKIIALYLPQYHRTPENDLWWGKGYTEWTAVKNSRPLYKGHKEPRKPLKGNYYDLSDETGKTWKWQAELANKYNIYGFCIYHYWFKGKKLLYRPMEILREHPEIDIHYCICWANETWCRNWYDQDRTVLMKQSYGQEKDWVKHYEYLNTFFQDERYIKINNKPMINIYHSQDIDSLKEMLELWKKLAQKNGFDGIYVVSGVTNKGMDKREELIDARYMFEPGYTLKNNLNMLEQFKYIFSTATKRMVNKVFKTEILEHIIDIRVIYKHIENIKLKPNTFPGTFPQWDNTPRTKHIGLSYINSTPELFKKHLEKLIEKYSDKEFLYINAWNEWGEGAYLEPDEENGFGFLEAIKEATRQD